MAQKLTLIDDVDGTVIGDGGGTVRFSMDGTSYEVDLTEKNATKLRGALKPFIAAARRVQGTEGSSRSASSASSTRNDPQRLKAIRAWANANGRSVANRGRVPAEILDAYDAAH